MMSAPAPMPQRIARMPVKRGMPPMSAGFPEGQAPLEMSQSSISWIPNATGAAKMPYQMLRRVGGCCAAAICARFHSVKRRVGCDGVMRTDVHDGVHDEPH